MSRRSGDCIFPVRRSPFFKSSIAAIFLWGVAWLPANGAEKVNALNPDKNNSLARVEWKKLSGRVDAYDLKNRSLQLRDKNGNVAHIVVDQYVQIFRDWRLIELNEVNLHDHLIVKRSADGVQ